MLGRLNLLAVICFLVVSACASSPSVVRASQFEIVDAKGRVRGTFGCDPITDRPWLTIMDEDSNPMAFLALSKMGYENNPSSHELGPVLHMQSAKGSFGTTVAASGEGVMLQVWSSDQRSIGFDIDKESTVITTVDKDGHELRAKLSMEKGTLHLDPVVGKDGKAPTEPTPKPISGESRAIEPVGLSSRELDVLETVFRYQFEHNQSGQREPSCIFLALAKRSDPPPALMSCFAAHDPSVEPVSASDPSPREGVHHPQKKDYCIIFRLDTIRWLDDGTVELVGGYYANGTSASEDTYRAELKDGKWVVLSDKLHWIS